MQVNDYNHFQSTDVYQLEDGFKWKLLKDVKIELPRNSFVEVEFVEEYEGKVGII